MKKTGLYTMMISVLIVSVLNASQFYYHDLDGSHVNLVTCDSLVTIKFNPAFPIQFETFSQAMPGLKDNHAPVMKSLDFVEFGVDSGYGIDSLISQLRQLPQVEMVTPTIQWSQHAIAYFGDRLIVEFKNGTTQTQISNLLSQYGLSVLRAPNSISVCYLLKMSQTSPPDPFSLCNQIYATGLVVYSYPDLYGNLIEQYMIPNDSYFNLQWSLKRDSSFFGLTKADIDMDLAWDYHLNNPNVVVGIVDAAFDIDHADLDQSKIWQPFDAASDDWQDSTVDYSPRLPLDSNALNKVYWHGTACLGLICPKTNNSMGVASTAPWVYFTPVKVIDDNVATDYYPIGLAYQWLLYANVNVVSLSIGWSSPIPAVTEAIQNGYARGIAYIQAAGNTGGRILFPGYLPEVLTVGATEEYDVITDYSSRGSALDVVAPSNNLPTIDITGLNGYSPNYGTCVGNVNYWCDMSGTSASTPEVAAVAACVLSRKPGLVTSTSTAEPLYEVMRHSSVDQINPADPVGYDTTYGWGRLNANKALLAVSHGDANNDGTINISDALFIGDYIFSGGAAPTPDVLIADANCDRTVNISDMIFLLQYIFNGGPAPSICY